MHPAADGLVAEGVQGRRGDNGANATRVGGGIGVADIAGEVCGNVAACLDDGAVDRTCLRFSIMARQSKGKVIVDRTSDIYIDTTTAGWLIHITNGVGSHLTRKGIS